MTIVLTGHNMSFFSFDAKFNKDLANRNIDEELVSDFLVTSLYFSQLSYFPVKYIQKKLMALGPLHTTVYSIRGVQVVFAEFDTFIIVGFRGSEHTRWQELKTDMQFWKTEFNCYRVHSGFLELLNVVKDHILVDISESEPNKRLIYTGHSLGGALAYLLALEHKPTDICVFGSPRVGGEELQEYFKDINVMRIMAENDFVINLPPKFMGYTDIGNRISCPGKKGKWESHKLKTYLEAILNDRTYSKP